MDTNTAAIHDRSLSPNPVKPDRRSSAEGYEAIAAGHPNSRIDELLPWNFDGPSS